MATSDPVGSLRVGMTADTAEFDSDMDKARKSVRKTTTAMGRQFKQFRASVTNSVKSIFTFRSALVAVAGVGALGYLIKQNIEAADAIGKTARSIGISAESLQELQHAAELSGLGIDEFNQGMLAFSRVVGEARYETGTLAGILKEMDPALLSNVAAADSVEQAFDHVVVAASGMSNVMERNVLLAAAFGEGAGLKMANLIDNGTESIDAMRQEARDLGLVLSNDLVANAAQANDQLTRMFKVISVNLTRSLVSVSPHVVRLGDAFAEIIPEIIEFTNRFLPDEFLPADALRARIDEVQAEFDRLEGLSQGADDFMSGLAELSFYNANPIKELSEVGNELDRLKGLLEDRIAADELINEIIETGDASDKTTKDIATLVAGLNFELDQLGRNTVEQELYNAAKGAGLKVTEDFRAQVEPLVAALEAERLAAEAVEEAHKERDDLLARGAALTESLRTEQEIYNDTLEEQRLLLDAGAISFETFSRGAEDARMKLDEAADAARKNKDLVDDLGSSLTKSFDDAVISGGKLSDVLRGLAQDLHRLLLQQATSTLGDAGSGFLGDLVAASLGSTGGSAPAGLGAGVNRGFASGGQHRGGFRIVGENGPELESTGPARYYSNKRTRDLFHGDSGSAGPPVTVNVYAPPGSSVDQQESSGPGGRSIDVVIDEITAKNVGSPGSRTGRAIRNTFAGVQPQLAGR